MDELDKPDDARREGRSLHEARAAAGGDRGRLGQTPFSAVVVDLDGQLVGYGHNTVRAGLDPTAHVEIAAIRAAWRRLGAWQMPSGSTIYSSCEPCLLCFYVIAQIGFRRGVRGPRGGRARLQAAARRRPG